MRLMLISCVTLILGCEHLEKDASRTTSRADQDVATTLYRDQFGAAQKITNRSQVEPFIRKPMECKVHSAEWNNDEVKWEYLTLWETDENNRFTSFFSLKPMVSYANAWDTALIRKSLAVQADDNRIFFRKLNSNTLIGEQDLRTESSYASTSKMTGLQMAVNYYICTKINISRFRLSLRTTAETFFKFKPQDPSTLSVNQKCYLTPGMTFDVQMMTYPDNHDHYQIKLLEEIPDCPFGKAGAIGFAKYGEVVLE